MKLPSYRDPLRRVPWADWLMVAGLVAAVLTALFVAIEIAGRSEMTPAARPIDAEELARIEALAAAATPGPWDTEVVLYGNGHARWIRRATGVHQRLAKAVGDVGPKQLTDANAAFIADARTSVPALVAAMRARDAEIERLRAVVNEDVIASAIIQTSSMVPRPASIDDEIDEARFRARYIAKALALGDADSDAILKQMRDEDAALAAGGGK